ncbi:hypothetical protein GCM10027280_26830 [Micromonospora polyrhachis]|uniref:Uncharacterized protein n=1 Tax=Micromonospora polyrhachis TaxID=1282883 RepID=A0A7W7SNP4_9ACTN|nr:hypothetical protein [Micromonospora polyrhachis]MBB4957776.1 hypothetical protein [Micromonospora polyrhachis]
MRFGRAIVGILLLIIGLPGLLVGGALWMVLQHRDDSGAFSASMEKLDTPGYAVVVPDLATLLYRDAPFTRTDQGLLRLTAQTPDGAVFLGLAPTDTITAYLAEAPYVAVDRVAVTRGPLPVRVKPVMPVQSSLPGPNTSPVSSSEPPVEPPRAQSFWVQQGYGTIDIDHAALRDQGLGLVLMRADAEPGISLDMRAEVRTGWLDPMAWGSLAGGVVLTMLGVAVLVWRSRPREVIFVVEPDQVPLLAARVGISSLAELGRVGRARGSVPTLEGELAADDDLAVDGDHALDGRQRALDSQRCLDGEGAVDGADVADSETDVVVQGPAGSVPPSWPVETVETLPVRPIEPALVPGSRPVTLADVVPYLPAGAERNRQLEGVPPVRLVLAWPSPAPDQVSPAPAGQAAPAQIDPAPVPTAAPVAPAQIDPAPVTQDAQTPVAPVPTAAPVAPAQIDPAPVASASVGRATPPPAAQASPLPAGQAPAPAQVGPNDPARAGAEGVARPVASRLKGCRTVEQTAPENAPAVSAPRDPLARRAVGVVAAQGTLVAGGGPERAVGNLLAEETADEVRRRNDAKREAPTSPGCP